MAAISTDNEINMSKEMQLIWVLTKAGIFFLWSDNKLIKVCQTQSADLSVFVLFFLFFILFYFSLQPPASLDFSVISQPISMKFGMLIVLDETNRLNIFSSQ